MTMDNKLVELLNDQVTKEYYSSYLYLQFANYFSDEGLDGFCNWYTIQAKEELDHANGIVDFMRMKDLSIKLKAIPEPKCKCEDHLGVLKEALAHEEYVSDLINKIYDRAVEVRDFSTTQFLNWYVKEQVEEEHNARDLITKYELYGADKKNLYDMDKELGARTYVPAVIG